jgi:uncharacterized protein (TIGR02246 family)
MSGSPLDLHLDLDKSRISAVRLAWIEAVKTSDADRLVDLVTQDVVGVHANGQCTIGKQSLRDFFLKAFDQFNFEGSVESSDVVVHGIWAVQIDEVKTTRTRVGGEGSMEARFRAVFVFSRQLDDSWKISRIIELQD